MTVQTHVTWTIDQPSTEDTHAIGLKAKEMLDEGKTLSGIPDVVMGETQYVATRAWTTLADAQEWATFIQTFNPDAVIIDEPA